jgi:hypothetical protein
MFNSFPTTQRAQTRSWAGELFAELERAGQANKSRANAHEVTRMADMPRDNSRTPGG